MHRSRSHRPRRRRATVRATLTACAATALAVTMSDVDGGTAARAGAPDLEQASGGELPSRRRFSPEPMATDELVAAVKRGDHFAGTELYRRHHRRLHSLMRRMLGNRDDADDATQQAFLRAFEAIPRLELGREPFESWLFTIARHHAIDLLRVRGRSQSTDPTDLTAAREQLPHRDQAPEASREDRANVQAIVAGLSAAQQSVLVLTYVYGCSTDETAAALGVNPATIRQLNSRALRKLSRSPRLRRLSGRP